MPDPLPEPEINHEALEGKKVVICVGNAYMKDDGIVIFIARELGKLDLGARLTF